ncbi:protein kinase domain-containing protein [Kitasatospora sp. NPDC004240]
MIGRALNGRYELVEILGVGGMATVWRGFDHVLGRQVAVKVLDGGLADDPRFAERFGQEAQHAAMLVHPRIVTVFDSGVDEGSPYIVMELVQGQSLAALLARQGALPVERAIGIAAAVCEGLEVAHTAGLVHRDVKPGNIMITDDGGVKVVDFGIARAGSSENLTRTAMVVGTAAYLSPEQATAAPLDARSDLYSVGCVLYEMLTGAQPFVADSPVEIAAKHVNEHPVPPSVVRPGLSAAVDSVVLRLLAKNPGHRPATAAHAQAQLVATVPASAVPDRTSELLAGAAAPTQMLPPVPAAVFVEPQRTSLLPPLPPTGPRGFDRAGYGGQDGSGYGGQDGSGYDRGYDGPVRESRRKPLLLGALGLVGIAGAAVLGLTAFDEPPADAAAPRPSATATAAPGATPAATPTAAASTPAATPTAPATTPANPKDPAAAIAAFRQTVAQTQPAKDQERHAEVVRMLGEAIDRLKDDQPEAAERELRNAQRVVKDLAKKHAVDERTAQAWQNRLSTLINTVEKSADQHD